MSTETWPEWNGAIEKRRAMSKLPPLPLKSTQQTGPRMHCCLAQIFDADGNAVASIESTDDPAQATELAALFAEAPGLRLRTAELEAQLASGHLVDKGALQMVINALRRDAAEGKVARGEMADALEAQLASGQQPLSELDAFEEWAKSMKCRPESPANVRSVLIAGMWAAWQARAIEAAHGIKAQP
jgi:hypothetical protein